MRKTKVVFFVLFLLAYCLCRIYPVQVKKIELKSYEDFQKGDLKGTSIDSRGRLSIGPEIKYLKGPEKEYYLSLDFIDDKEIFVGVGHNAAIYKILPATGKVEEIFKTDQLDVYAILVKDNGEVYAGTSPSGKIYKIGKDKKVVEFYDIDEKFIWDIKEDKDGNIICAVGNNGGVYNIKGPGDGYKVFAPEDSHIVVLYITKDNSILAGSGDRGILYKINNGKVKVLFDSPFEEIKGICEDINGNIFFSATKGITTYKEISKNGIEPFFNDKKNKKTTGISNEKSALYCVHTNGMVEKIWSSEKEYIYSVFYDKRDDGVFVCTGNSGRLYKIKKDRSFNLIFESESAQLFKIKGNRNGLILITNNSASIIKIEDRLNPKGTYFSKIFDLQVKSRLGKIYWDSLTQSNSGISFFVRAGNSNIPDKTWSEWSPPFYDKENSNLNISGFRYIQVKVLLNSSNMTKNPNLDNFRLFYVQTNLKPLIEKIEISKPDHMKIKDKEENKKLKNEKYLNIKWEANDPNDDLLKYNVFIKKFINKNWIILKKDITKKELILWTELFEDGKYLIKVVADDSFANPHSQSQSHTKISQPFFIDSTAPLLSDFIIKNNRISFKAIDTISTISEVCYSFDGNVWFPVFPKDMINDSKSEEYEFDIIKQNSQTIVFIKVSDEFKNYKVFQKEF